jgi:hypothetical protein
MHCVLLVVYGNWKFLHTACTGCLTFQGLIPAPNNKVLQRLFWIGDSDALLCPGEQRANDAAATPRNRNSRDARQSGNIRMSRRGASGPHAASTAAAKREATPVAGGSGNDSAASSGPEPDSSSSGSDASSASAGVYARRRAADTRAGRARSGGVRGSRIPSGPLAGVSCSALVCTVHSQDPLGLAHADETQRLHSMLRLSGVFVTTAGTVSRAVSMLRRDTSPAVFDAIIAVVTSMRLLEGALNLLHELQALPRQGVSRGSLAASGSGSSGFSAAVAVQRPCVILLAADGCVHPSVYPQFELNLLRRLRHRPYRSLCLPIPIFTPCRFVFEAASARLKAAGAHAVERFPATAASIERIAESCLAPVQSSLDKTPPLEDTDRDRGSSGNTGLRPTLLTDTAVTINVAAAESPLVLGAAAVPASGIAVEVPAGFSPHSQVQPPQAQAERCSVPVPGVFGAPTSAISATAVLRDTGAAGGFGGARQKSNAPIRAPVHESPPQPLVPHPAALKSTPSMRHIHVGSASETAQRKSGAQPLSSSAMTVPALSSLSVAGALKVIATPPLFPCPFTRRHATCIALRVPSLVWVRACRRSSL